MFEFLGHWLYITSDFNGKDEINGLRVSCALCTDFDLCPECFACGAEIGNHKNSHKYFFSNNGNFSIFPKSPCQEDKGRRR